MMIRASSSRMVEARYWANKFDLIGRGSEWFPFWNSQGLVFSVWGITGVGKSVLVRKEYFKHMIRCLDQPTKYSWVDVPQTFSLTDLSIRLLTDFYSADIEAKESTAVGIVEGQDPIQGCRNILQQGNYFIVIDGLQSTHDWDLIKDAFISEPIKGGIFVITNKESAANHCVDRIYDNVKNVKCLEADTALNLYRKIAWNGKELTWDQEVLSRLTMTKYGGLPKVIVAIGEHHCKSYPSSYSYGSRLRWLEDTNANFMRILETLPSLRGLFSWMHSYFDDCPDSLKPCHNIKPGRLLRRWIAEGYCRDTPGRNAKENAEKFFAEFVKLSIIQQQHSPRKADVWQVNGFFREYIISRPMEDYLVLELEGRCSLNTQRVGQHLAISSTWERDKLVFESIEMSRLRSLTVFGKWESFFISANANMRLLRVLDLQDASGVTDGDLEQIGKILPRLKFLSLRGCQDITRLPCSLVLLRQLQTPDIKGTSIISLPPAIIKLEKLQYVHAGATCCTSTLSEQDNGNVTGVASTPIAECASTTQPGGAASTSSIPTQAEGDGASTSQPPPQPPAAAATVDNEAEARTARPWSRRPHGGSVCSWLSNLRRQALVSSSHDGVRFSTAAAGGIGKLATLHTLGVVNVSSEGGKAVLRELTKLTHLCKLGLSGINRKNWHDLCSTISGHGHLESLSVRLDHDQDVYCLGDISTPPKKLKSLKLYGCNVHVSPVWMKQLGGLTKGYLENLELIMSTQEDIDNLMYVPCQHMFRHLSLKPIQHGELRYPSRCSGADFSAAKVLTVQCSSYSCSMVFGDWISSYVEMLVVHCSTTEVSLKLSGLEKLKNLKEVWLKGSYSGAVKLHLQEIVNEHPKKPVLKLEEQPSLS